MNNGALTDFLFKFSTPVILFRKFRKFPLKKISVFRIRRPHHLLVGLDADVAF